MFTTAIQDRQEMADQGMPASISTWNFAGIGYIAHQSVGQTLIHIHGGTFRKVKVGNTARPEN
jgi:hypothetical protein